MVEDDGKHLGYDQSAEALPPSLATWLGYQREIDDTIAPRLIAAFRATLPGLLAPGAVPPGLHWCLAPDLAPPEALGRDGHPRPGLFQPPMPLPRRMWAGGALSSTGILFPDDTVTRLSTVEAITPRHGRSGPLRFLTMRHLWQVDGETRINERQDLVYRADPAPDTPPPEPPRAEAWPEARRWHLTPDPTLLFRYSALSFNGYRIHYDQPYATQVEGYDGLVVHGPLQATLMLNLAADVMGEVPARFDYRALAPLVAGEPIHVESRQTEAGLDLRVRRETDGVVTMAGQATGPADESDGQTAR